ncbi:D-glycero-beta-D-manno-heptose 1-phosphate adenylyltransferase [uncultured Desulfobacter sp.]|uniref:D-glycero-beta-D-manno-heptose 1-phosphate adenylyltransferase n=1 Tax=uncultured Desulfobacter sp. TaxID=240139 RepID=UPI0029F48E21|nr:D-glycero-beta-D-manno-heptose 1-phosphate adenylyltransferase [uncultured Desulfobacter sp.]
MCTVNMVNKIVERDEMCRLAREYKSLGRTVVFTNGCFDILHAGHVAYLQKAKSFGDVLVLGLNSDLSVQRIKGDLRPVICQAQRARVVAALSCVDHVVLFDAPDPEDLIRGIVPQILVKGADWPEDKIIGAKFVKDCGGRVARVAFEEDISTSKIIERIGQRFYGGT